MESEWREKRGRPQTDNALILHLFAFRSFISVIFCSLRLSDMFDISGSRGASRAFES